MAIILRTLKTIANTWSSGSNGIAYDRNRNVLYIGDCPTTRMSVVDAITLTTLKQFTNATAYSDLYSVSYDRSRNILFNTSGSLGAANAIFITSPINGATLKTWACPENLDDLSEPQQQCLGLIYDHATDQIYIADSVAQLTGERYIYIFSGNGTLLKSIDRPATVGTIYSFALRNDQLWISDATNKKLHILNKKDMTVIAQDIAPPHAVNSLTSFCIEGDILWLLQGTNLYKCAICTS